MLNISENSTIGRVDTRMYDAFDQVNLSSANKMWVRWLVSTLLIFIIFLFLPWTQNIQSKGKVTTLRPEQRPQTIQSTIAGQIQKWYVQEGQFVAKGDTLLHLAEVKTDYFDPNLVGRTAQQVEAKEGAITSYAGKANALGEQIEAMRQELVLKREQLENKIEQAKFKVRSDSIDYEAAKVDYQTSVNRLERAEEMFDKGIYSRYDYESRQLKVQEANAKMVAWQNKLDGSRAELTNARIALNNVTNEYNSKIAKAESDRFSTLSEKFTAEADVTKLQNQLSNYELRNSFYYITAPQDGFVAQALSKGLGEIIKEGEAIVNILPADYELAVEMYVRPLDLPLISIGQEVRFMFDGWPAFVFAGWPNQSFGTYSGKVVAIDNIISANGQYRILVGPNPEKEPWPEALRPGSGAEGIALINDVPLWYELWRQLNGFPPDNYDEENAEDPKLKAPVRALK